VLEYIGKEVVMGIRPECIHDEPMYLSSMPESVIETDVEVTELMGAEIYLYLVSEEQNMIARVSSRSKARAGDVIKVALDMSRIHLFDKETERYIVH
jgi:multiple sugar transport system ATP-binding protein